MHSSYLPLIAVALPMAGTALLLIFGRRSAKVREAIAVATTALALMPVAAMIPAVLQNRETLTARLPLLLTTTFTVDPMGLLFALFTAFVWFASTLYAVGYMRHEHKPLRFYAFLVFLLGANLGVVLAGDLVTLFLFFEALGLLGYYLVIHMETTEAFAAGAKFIWMAIIGGLSLLAGTLLLAHYSGTWAITPALERLSGSAALVKYAIAGLMILGFGVKAGMIPVHTWLPDAHPVAPSPASALLSGVMIKAGAYGIIRVGATIMRPPFVAEGAAGAVEAAGAAAHGAEAAWLTTVNIGYVLIWIGVITMFLGVVMALLQENAKRMLAYHSISQMGYILMGAGAGAFLAQEGALSFGASMYHVVNHALFKGLLFLGVGAVFFRTGELNMYKLGGLWRKMPLTFVCTLVAALAISGIPPFNGFASKTLLHHAIVEAFDVSRIAGLRWAEIVFIITGGGTLCSFMKLIVFTFLGRRDERFSDVKDAPPIMVAAMLLMVVPIVVIGVYPVLMTRGFFIPSTQAWGLATEKLAEVQIFTWHNLEALVPSLLIGVTVFVVGTRTGLFHVHFPAWFGVDYWYLKLADQVVVLSGAVGRMYGRAAAGVGTALEGAESAYQLAKGYAGRRYRRFSIAFFSRLTRMIELEKRRYRRPIVTLLFGSPVLREWQLAFELEQRLHEERHRLVETAIKETAAQLKTSRLSRQARQERLDLARRTASAMADDLATHRLAVARELMRDAPPEIVVHEFARAEERMSDTRKAVTAMAERLASAIEGSEEILNKIATETLASRDSERFDQVLTALVADYRRAGERFLEAEGGLKERGARMKSWMSVMARLAAAAVTEERIPWSFAYNPQEIERTRAAIRRYSRDMSLNVLLVAAVAAFTGLLLMLANR